MKKIKFGSFPFVSIQKSNRMCIDSFSMKNFSALITMNTSMGGIRSDVQKYITPDIIMKYFKNNNDNDQYSYDYQHGQKTSDAKTKMDTMKRAFNALKEFSKTLASIPFYRETKTLPIYLEHPSKNGSHDYDFLLLSNDLIVNQILDEITYDDSLSMIFLFLKDQLYPRTRLNELGKNSAVSVSFRSNIAKFLEFSKTNHTDPISAMIKIIEGAGENKLNNARTDSSLGQNFIRRAKKAVDKSIGKELNRLFRNGQIVDTNAFINKISFSDIYDFNSDTSDRNRYDNAHVTDQKMYRQMDSVERQYTSAKVQEYNKILSMVDALMTFNKIDIRLEDLDETGGVVVSIKQDESTENTLKMSIKKRDVVDSIKQTYFEPFVINIVNKTNTIYNGLLTISNSGRTHDSSYNPNTSSLDNYNAKIQEALNKASKLREQAGDTNNMDERDSLNRSAEMQEKLANQYRNFMMINNVQLSLEDKASKADRLKLKSALTYNIDIIQSDFTAVLSSLESSFDIDSKFIDFFAAAGGHIKVDYNDIEKTEVFQDAQLYTEQLVGSIIESMRDSAMEVLLNKDTDFSEDNHKSRADEISKVDAQLKLIESKVKEIINQQLFVLLSKLGKQFGDPRLKQTSNYVDGRIERNNVISKALKNPQNFKTYIFNDKMLLSLYDTLRYIDMVKYNSGLIMTPPSFQSNDKNKIDYVLKRFGLENNPVFILSDHGNKAMFSSPDYLSLTGQAFIEEVYYRDLEAICKIDYSKDLWSTDQMFKQLNVQDQYDKIKQSRDTILSNNKVLEDAYKSLNSLKTDKAKLDKEYNKLNKDNNADVDKKTALKASIDELRKEIEDKEANLKKSVEANRDIADEYKRNKEKYQKIQDVPTTQRIGIAHYNSERGSPVQVDGYNRKIMSDPKVYSTNKNKDKNKDKNKQKKPWDKKQYNNQYNPNYKKY